MTGPAVEASLKAALDRHGLGKLKVDAAVVAGSGLGAAVAGLETEVEIPYEELPGLGKPTAPGHEGVLRIGRLSGRTVAAFLGRRHFYENRSMEEAAMTARVAHALGASFFLPLCAVGAISREYEVGDWVFWDDHINLMGQNPLAGVSGGGAPPFIDLSALYRQDLFGRVKSLGRSRPVLHRGVAAAFSGPTYETPAEIRMAALAGAAIVTMSTVPETVWAKYLGMEVAAWGKVVNPAAGISKVPLTHEDVLAQAGNGGEDGAFIVEATIDAWARLNGD